jgi:hypothetical protein
MAEQCYGRLAHGFPEGGIYFPKDPNQTGRNTRIHFEYRCKGKSIDQNLCNRCLERKTKRSNNFSQKYHGLVTEPYFEDSLFYGSPAFESKVKKLGMPSEDDMARAKKAQEEARKGVMIEKPKVMAEQPIVSESKPEPKKRGRKKATEPVPVPLPPPPPPEPEPHPDPTPPPPPNPEPKPTQTKRTYKKKAKPVVPEKSVVPIQAVETSTLPTEVEIVKIVVRPFFANNTQYFRDPVKNKLYGVGKDKRPSNYVGRWDPESETIDTEFPDSDAE